MNRKEKMLAVTAIATIGGVGTVSTIAHADTQDAVSDRQQASPKSAHDQYQAAQTDAQQQLQAKADANTKVENDLAQQTATANANDATKTNDQIAQQQQQIDQIKAKAAKHNADAMAQKEASVNQTAQEKTSQENTSYQDQVASQTKANQTAESQLAKQNDQKLAEANKKVTTPVQKKNMTDEAKADAKKQADQAHAAFNRVSQTAKQVQTNALSKAQAALAVIKKQAEQEAKDKVAEAKQAQKDAQNSVKKTIDDQKDAQVDVTSAANVKTNDEIKYNKANSKVKTIQADLNKVKKLKMVVNAFATNQTYLDELKKSRGELIIEPDDNQVDYAKLDQAANTLNKENNYKSDPVAKLTPVTLTNNGTLSFDDAMYATKYAAVLINPIRKALGVPLYKISKGSVQIALDSAEQYLKDNWTIWEKLGHDVVGLDKVAKEWGTNVISESLAGDDTFAHVNKVGTTKVHSYKGLTRDDLQRGVYNALKGFLFADADASYGHTQDILGTRLPKDYDNPTKDTPALNYGDIYLGVSFDMAPDKEAIGDEHYGYHLHPGEFHFNAESDPNSSYVQGLSKLNYHFNELNKDSKINQPEYVEEFAIPDKAGNDNTQVVRAIQSALVVAQRTANDAKKVFDDAQMVLTQANDKMIMVNKAYDSAIKNAKNAENKYKRAKADLVRIQSADYVDSNYSMKVKTANENYNKTINDAKTQLNTKLAQIKVDLNEKLNSIKALPDSTSDLKAQLDQQFADLKQVDAKKLDDLKVQHEANLQKIQADAKAELANYKEQLAKTTVDQLKPHQDKLANLKAQHEAFVKANNNKLVQLKTKDDQEYAQLKGQLDNELSQLHKQLFLGNNNSKDVISGQTDDFTVNGGKTHVVLPTADAEPTFSNSESGLTKKVANRQAEANQQQLPQTGTKNSVAMSVLGIALSMFGFGMVSKKRED